MAGARPKKVLRLVASRARNDQLVDQLIQGTAVQGARLARDGRLRLLVGAYMTKDGQMHYFSSGEGSKVEVVGVAELTKLALLEDDDD